MTLFTFHWHAHVNSIDGSQIECNFGHDVGFFSFPNYWLLFDGMPTTRSASVWCPIRKYKELDMDCTSLAKNDLWFFQFFIGVKSFIYFLHAR